MSRRHFFATVWVAIVGSNTFFIKQGEQLRQYQWTKNNVRFIDCSVGVCNGEYV
jgi:hypothetical protein